MFHNPGAPIGSGETYTDVSLQLRLHIADDEHLPQTAVTYHLLRLSDAPCSIAQGHSFQVPLSPQQFVFSGTHQEQDASNLLIREPSKVVYWGAHTHGWEGGIAVSAKKNGETVEVFTTQHSAEDLYRYDTPHGNRDIMFDTGDVLSIEAIYDASTTSTIRGAMGHLGLFLAPRE